MPTNKINVADGLIANWHNFKARGLSGSSDSAVVKDYSVLMSTSSGGTHAYESLLKLWDIWSKLGGVGNPIPSDYFDRDSLAASKSPPLLGASFTSGQLSKSSTSAVITLNYPTSGAAPTSVTLVADPTGAGATITQTVTLTFNTGTLSYPATATITGLSPSTQYEFSYYFTNASGTGTTSNKITDNTTA